MIAELRAGIVDDYGRANELQPDAGTHAERGWDFLFLLESPAQALPEFERTIELRPETKARDHLGVALCRVQLGDRSKGVAAAETALKLGQDREKNEESSFLLYNAAHVFALAAGRVSIEMGGRSDPELAQLRQRYEGRALELLEQAMLSRPEAERGSFWKQMTHGDAALTAVRPLTGYGALERKYGPPRK